MLEGLDDIPWATMQHVYGSAEKVPGWIRDLTSSERDIRYKALLNLQNTLYHQGTIYKPTVYAIPFLLELLSHPHVEDKTKSSGDNCAWRTVWKPTPFLYLRVYAGATGCY